jgi:hypothetical protein
MAESRCCRVIESRDTRSTRVRIDAIDEIGKGEAFASNCLSSRLSKLASIWLSFRSDGRGMQIVSRRYREDHNGFDLVAPHV